jgi:AcrR family transcriptional regulator
MNSSRQRRSKELRDTGTRARLVAATQGCLRTGGVARTSSRAIAERAGANLGAITYYFGSKEQLVDVALAAELHEWTQPVLDLLAAQDEPAMRLLRAVNLLTATFEEQHERVQGLLEAFVHAARAHHSENPLTTIWRDLRNQLATVISELQDSGAIPKWVEPDAMAALILAVAAGTVISVTVEPDDTNHRDIATQFANLLLATATRPTPTA